MSSALDRLHPVVVHHIVNTLGWRSLRALQDQAAGPVLDGADALLLAPTAGGKTEAAMFPLLTAMDTQRWPGMSVIYVCPLKALLNNLQPRLETYAGWLGRRVAVWHGDVTASARQRILREPPDVLLTTPESLEAMLISLKVEHGRVFTDLRAVVVDEVHTFAGDDRGWHLLAVLERLARVAGRPIQRIGLSATVGNPADLLDWLQGAGKEDRSAVVVSPDLATAAPPGDIELDYVGSVSNAATVIASLHRGEKRLVFCDSRQLVEEIGAALRERGVTTFLSHASLPADDRRRAEQAFGEPVVPPPQPRHIVAQQLLALCLQEHRIGSQLWAQAWNGLAPFDRSAEPILRYLVEQGFVDQDGELLFIGPAAEQRFGHRHFMGMTAVFTAPPQFTVLYGRQEVGRTDPMLLTEKTDGPRLLLLGGRSWRVTWTDWKRRRCYVEPVPGGGKARWLTPGVSGASFALARAAREVLLGADPPVALTQRAKRTLADVRDEHLPAVHPAGTGVTRAGEDVRWWTWAGYG